MKEDVAVLIVAYNEAAIIGEVISKTPKDYCIYVVDDGSDDGTGDIARKYGAKVISLTFNVGQGAAAIVGYKTIAMEEHDFLVKMDGDGQHDPNEIRKFVEKLKSSGVDTVVGSRVLGTNYKGAPFARKIFLKPLTLLLNKLTGYNLTDSMCGFRAFRGKSLRKIIPIFEQIIEPEYMASEMWIRFSRIGITVCEIPVNMKIRKSGFSYKGLLRYALGIAIAIIRTKIDIHVIKR